jgi:hypothetical protein
VAVKVRPPSGGVLEGGGMMVREPVRIRSHEERAPWVVVIPLQPSSAGGEPEGLAL